MRYAELKIKEGMSLHLLVEKLQAVQENCVFYQSTFKRSLAYISLQDIFKPLDAIQVRKVQ